MPQDQIEVTRVNDSMEPTMALLTADVTQDDVYLIQALIKMLVRERNGQASDEEARALSVACEAIARGDSIRTEELHNNVLGRVGMEVQNENV